MDAQRAITTLITALGVLAAVAAPVAAQQRDALTPAQEKAVERLVEQYILEHPEVVVRAMKRLEAKRRAEEQAAVEKEIMARAAELREDPSSPFAGAPEGDVVVVEFFDYRCGVCKRVLPVVLRLLEKDRKVKLVYKDWPILGPESVFAARAALASRHQGKYVAFHNEMMKARGGLDEAAVMEIARRVGLDIDRLRRDMEGPEIAHILKRNFELADALRLSGTPSFVIGDTVVRGGRDYRSLQALVDKAREGGS